MSNRYSIAIGALILALILSIAVSWKMQRDLKRELREMTAANETVRASLGDLIHEIASKEKEIDRLTKLCETREPSSTRGNSLK
jgi:hypothetical protein